MKLRALFFALPLLLASSVSYADAGAGLRAIISRGEIRCGTDLDSKAYAYKDEYNEWQGVDANLCRVLSIAIFGNSKHIKMVNVQPTQISKALDSGKIDVMFGNTSLSATSEIKENVNAAELLYYDKQMLYTEPLENATSMEAYKGMSVCALNKSEDIANLREYNRKYNLGLRIMSFRNLTEARQAFYLKRCKMISAGEIYLRALHKMIVSSSLKPEVLPEVIAYRPVYAYVSNDNARLRIIVKWIFNALKLAEQQGITSKNADIFIGVSDTSTRNLLGKDTQLWSAFGLKSDWVKQAVKELGNYGEFYEKNLGAESEYNIEREKNNLINNGGLINPSPFI